MALASRRSTLLLSTLSPLVLALAAPQVRAADVYEYDGYRRPIDGSYRYQPPDAAGQWAGLYVGGSLGVGWGSSSMSGTGLDDISTEGMIGGVMAGYNFQMGAIVAGVEVDLGLTGLEGSESGGGLGATAGHDWLSSLRVRIGYATGSWLAYGTIGFAYTDFDLDLARAGFDLSQSDTLSGYAIGAGVEYALTPGISLRGELMHYGFDETTFTDSGSNLTTEPDITTIRAGVTIKFH